MRLLLGTLVPGGRWSVKMAAAAEMRRLAGQGGGLAWGEQDQSVGQLDAHHLKPLPFQRRT